MAAPVDAARPTTSGLAVSPAPINVGSPAAGTMLIVFARFSSGTQTTTSMSGYTELARDTSDASDDTTIVWWRWADGTEGATDDITVASSVKHAAICWNVTGTVNEAPAISTVVIGTTAANSANSGSVAPNSAPQDTLYISMSGGDGEGGAYTAAPTNYTNLVTVDSGTGGAVTSNVIIAGASRGVTASSSDDPGVFTHPAHNAGWAAYTVALRAAAAPAPLVLEQGFVNFQDPGVLSKALDRGRELWHRRRSGIFVPDLWLPNPVA